MIRIHHILCLSQTERLGERTTRWTITRKHTSTRRWSDHDHVWTGLKLIQLTGTQRTIKGNKDFSWPHSDHFQRASVITTTLELDINKIHRLIKIVVCCLSLEKFGWIFISCLNINCKRDLISHAQPGQLGRSSRSSTNERVSAPIGSSGCMSRSPWARSWIPNCSWWLFQKCEGMCAWKYHRALYRKYCITPDEHLEPLASVCMNVYLNRWTCHAL